MNSPRDQNTRLNPGIEAWLRDVGLLHLGSLFARESIDVDVLTDLTDQDLADIGVTLGDRRRFLKARQAYSDAVGSGKKPPVPSPPPDHVKVQETTAERRYMTVMFCDLAG